MECLRSSLTSLSIPDNHNVPMGAIVEVAATVLANVVGLMGSIEAVPSMHNMIDHPHTGIIAGEAAREEASNVPDTFVLGFDLRVEGCRDPSDGCLGPSVPSLSCPCSLLPLS